MWFPLLLSSVFACCGGSKGFFWFHEPSMERVPQWRICCAQACIAPMHRRQQQNFALKKKHVGFSADGSVCDFDSGNSKRWMEQETVGFSAHRSSLPAAQSQRDMNCRYTKAQLELYAHSYGRASQTNWESEQYGGIERLETGKAPANQALKGRLSVKMYGFNIDPSKPCMDIFRICSRPRNSTFRGMTRKSPLVRAQPGHVDRRRRWFIWSIVILFIFWFLSLLRQGRHVPLGVTLSSGVPFNFFSWGSSSMLH